MRNVRGRTMLGDVIVIFDMVYIFQEIEFGGYMIQQNVGGHPVAVYRFPPRTKFPDCSSITVWAGMTDPLDHQPPRDYVWTEQQKWGTGPECTTILCKPNGQVSFTYYCRLLKYGSR